jgi:hypothetical protein
MTDSPSIPRPSILLKQMSADRRRQAAQAFWRDESGANEQAEAIAAIAQRLKFRAKSVVVLPEAKKIQYLLDLPVIPEAVAARLLISHHIAHKRVMMAAFLDALGVAHDNGMIAEDAVIPQESDKIHAAVRAIAESFPAEDVALYLSTLSWQDPQTWAVLAKLPETRIPGKE